MGLFNFNRLREPIFLKETSSLQNQLEQLTSIDGQHLPEDIKSKLEKEIRNVNYGIIGEKSIDYELRNSHMLMYVLHDLHIKFGDLSAQIDYLIVTRWHIYVVECKNLYGNITINEDGNFIRSNNYGDEGIYSPIAQNQRHLDLMQRILQESKANMITKLISERQFSNRFNPIIVLANPKTIINKEDAPQEIKSKVIKADTLKDYIKKTNEKSKTGMKKYSDSEMVAIASFFLNAHNEPYKDYTSKYKTVIPEPVADPPVDKPTPQKDDELFETSHTCPACGSALKRISTKSGEFWGCSSHPECEYMLPLKDITTIEDDDENFAVLENIKLGDEQQRLFDTLDDHNNNDFIFVTGKAGTGKSILLKYFVKHTTKKAVVLASTGIAAMQISGQTLHSFFAFDDKELISAFKDVESKDYYSKDFVFPKVRIDSVTKRTLQNIDVLIIDEISMVRSDVMEYVNRKFQTARNSKEPFGGVQIIVFGDLYQLPPIISTKPPLGEQLKQHIEKFNSKYFFDAPVRYKKTPKIYELEHIYRQKEPSFQKMLNNVRVGNVLHNNTISEFNCRHEKNIPEDGVLTIATRNDTVNKKNKDKFDLLPGNAKNYNGKNNITTYGNNPEEHEEYKKLCIEYIRSINENLLDLKLKVGAQVMILRNDRQKPMRWANGMIGKVAELSDDIVKINLNGEIHSIERVNWHIPEQKNIDEQTGKINPKRIATFNQFPLCLAWSITIHKSQGQTHETLIVDFGERGAFAQGQAYVALSRCQSLEGLFLKETLKKDDICGFYTKVDKNLTNFIEGHKVPIPKIKRV